MGHDIQIGSQSDYLSYNWYYNTHICRQHLDEHCECKNKEYVWDIKREIDGKFSHEISHNLKRAIDLLKSVGIWPLSGTWLGWEYGIQQETGEFVPERVCWCIYACHLQRLYKRAIENPGVVWSLS